MRQVWLVMLAAFAMAAPLATAVAQESRTPVGFEDIKALYKEADLIVLFQAETVQANPAVAPRLVWEVKGPVIEVVKGKLLPGQILLHVDSIVRVFDMTRAGVEGKQFLAAIKPLSDAVDRRFQLVGQYAFQAASAEAEALRKLAETDAEAGAGGGNLELAVRPIDTTLPVQGPKVIEIRLTNKGSDSATYLQAPIAEKDRRLYLTGQGMLRIRDTTGRTIPDKGNVTTGTVPPPPPKPALILPNASFVETVDLSKYYDLPEGRYTLVLILATPDGRGRIPSNGFSFQVGTVNVPEAPEPPKVEPVKVIPTPPEKIVQPVAVGPTPPAEAAQQVPDPSQYKPGKASQGLAGLLKPKKSRYAVGEAVELEIRLINEGPRTLAVDTRLERTLTVQVQAVGDSPQPLVIRQVIPWPADTQPMPDERAYLRDGAFWGRTIDVNILYGKSLEELPAPTPEEIAAGKDLTYERHGKHLYGFPKAGLYNVTATYTVSRPKTPEGQAPVAQPREWWVGDVQTNTITIAVGGTERR